MWAACPAIPVDTTPINAPQVKVTKPQVAQNASEMRKELEYQQSREPAEEPTDNIFMSSNSKSSSTLPPGNHDLELANNTIRNLYAGHKDKLKDSTLSTPSNLDSPDSVASFNRGRKILFPDTERKDGQSHLQPSGEMEEDFRQNDEHQSANISEENEPEVFCNNEIDEPFGVNKCDDRFRSQAEVHCNAKDNVPDIEEEKKEEPSVMEPPNALNTNKFLGKSMGLCMPALERGNNSNKNLVMMITVVNMEQCMVIFGRSIWCSGQQRTS